MAQCAVARAFVQMVYQYRADSERDRLKRWQHDIAEKNNRNHNKRRNVNGAHRVQFFKPGQNNAGSREMQKKTVKKRTFCRDILVGIKKHKERNEAKPFEDKQFFEEKR